MDDLIENLLKVIVCRLVRNPQAVRIEKDDSARDGLVVYRVIVTDEDMGRVIGKRGRIAKSIRSIVRAAAMKNDLKVAVEIG